MVIFCTNCGSKLDDDSAFCSNCGNKVEKSNKKRKGLFGKLKREIELMNDEDIREAKKEVKRVVGGVKLNDSFLNELNKYGLSLNDGISIKTKLNSEIYSGEIKKADVKNRVNELLLENKLRLEYEIEEFRFIDELFESEEIKSKIRTEKISKSQINSIKTTLKNKVRFAKNKISKEEIKKDAGIELEKEICNIKINEQEMKKKNLLENKVKYVEDKIKESHPEIKLENFEKTYINNIKLYGTFDEIKNELNLITNKLINTHEKIGEYDFSGILIESGDFKRAGSEFRVVKPVTKDNDYKSYVFLKIFEDKIRIVGSEIKPFSFNPRAGRDMTIFFVDLININYSISFNYPNGEINFELSNHTRLKLISSGDDGKNIEIFYNLLNNVWAEFKNNKNESNIISNQNDRISTADELIKYAELYEKGFLSEDEFNALKKKLLGL